MPIKRRSAGSGNDSHAPALSSKQGKIKDRQFVTALARGIDILQCFSRSEPELGTVEIASMVNLPQPTVWRLCYTLMKKGLLTYSPLTKRLRLGVPVLGLGYAVVASQMIAEIARPHMQAIADRFRGTVSLGAADGLGMIYLQRCEGASVVLVNNRVGSRVPIAYSATGWAYLAALAPQAREDLVREIHAEEGPRWAQIEQRFRSALRKFHVDRYIINKGSLHRQINGVAVPLHFPDGDRPMGLGSSGINSIYTDEALRIIGGFLLDLASMLEAVPPRGRMAVYPVPGGH